MDIRNIVKYASIYFKASFEKKAAGEISIKFTQLGRKGTPSEGKPIGFYQGSLVVLDRFFNGKISVGEEWLCRLVQRGSIYFATPIKKAVQPEKPDFKKEIVKCLETNNKYKNSPLEIFKINGSDDLRVRFAVWNEAGATSNDFITIKPDQFGVFFKLPGIEAFPEIYDGLGENSVYIRVLPSEELSKSRWDRVGVSVKMQANIDPFCDGDIAGLIIKTDNGLYFKTPVLNFNQLAVEQRSKELVHIIRPALTDEQNARLDEALQHSDKQYIDENVKPSAISIKGMFGYLDMEEFDKFVELDKEGGVYKVTQSSYIDTVDVSEGYGGERWSTGHTMEMTKYYWYLQNTSDPNKKIRIHWLPQNILKEAVKLKEKILDIISRSKFQKHLAANKDVVETLQKIDSIISITSGYIMNIKIVGLDT